MGICIYPSICQDKTINVHRSVGLQGSHLSISEQNIKKKIVTNYQIKDIGYKIKISLIFFCNNEILKNSFTYKFKLFIDNSDMEEENFNLLGNTEASICQSKIKYNKIFETFYFFSKGQRIKICCLENEKNINTSLFYLGKMINGFESPKLIIQKDDVQIGELLIIINKENNNKDKKCVFFVEISSKANSPENIDYFFTINKSSDEVIYSSEIFNFSNTLGNECINSFSEIRKNFIFDKDREEYVIFKLYKIKELNKDIDIQNKNDKEIKDLEYKENKKTRIENELVNTITVSINDLIENNGRNTFKINNGILSYLFDDSISMKINYSEKEYKSFFDYISCQLHLNLVLILNKAVLTKYSSTIKNIINIFALIISLYNRDEQKYIYLKNKVINKANNYNDFYDDITNDENGIKIVFDNKEIFPEINSFYNNYINSEMNKGINKYFIVLIFTDEKFNDLNCDNDYNSKLYFPDYDKYSNEPINFKIFNFGSKKNYIEKNDININIFKNFNENLKYNRILFQFYNVNDEIKDKKKLNIYLNDIPYLIEDYFEIQKSAKFSIFDD
jgi:hypothetical protein